MDQPEDRGNEVDEVEEQPQPPKFTEWLAAHRGGVADIEFQEGELSVGTDE